MPATDKPLITFALLAYNQAQFIGEAVTSAFSQTYSPLEIVLSDDCSKDGTFAIMRSMCDAYAGPHRTKLNRNPQRRGIGGHLDAVMELSRGELILLGAGDDISLPDRTETIFQAWDLFARRATSIYSDYTSISESGKPLESGRESEPSHETRCEEEVSTLLSFVESLKPVVCGCTHAFAPRLFSLFGPLTDSVTYEDLALSFRSYAVGSVLHVNRPLVLYRRHSENVSFHKLEGRIVDSRSFASIEAKHRRRLKGFIQGCERFLKDLDTLVEKKLLRSQQADEVRNAIEKKKRKLELELVLLDGTFPERVGAFCQLYSSGSRGSELVAGAARCLPRSLYRQARIIKNKGFRI